MSDLDHTALDKMIESVRGLPELAIKAAPEAAKAWERTIVEQIHKGVNAEGVAWEPRKSDGKKPLEGAEKHLTVVSLGASLFARLTDHISRHHLGRARGGIVRSILPTKDLPEVAKAAIKSKLDEAFKKLMFGE